MLIVLGLFIYNLKQPSVAKKKEDSEGIKKKSKKEEKESQGSHMSVASHRNLEERLRGMLESQSADMKLTGSHGNTPPLKRPRSNSNKSYGSVEIDNEGQSPKTKRHKGLLKQ